MSQCTCQASVRRAESNFNWQTYDVDLVPVLLLALRDLFDNYGVKEFFISASLRNQETFTAFLKSCGRDLRRLPFGTGDCGTLELLTYYDSRNKFIPYRTN